MKRFFIELFWELTCLLGCILTLTVVGAIVGLPMVVISIDKLKLIKSKKRFGQEAQLRKVFIRDEGSKGTYQRETDMFLLESPKRGKDIFSSLEVEENFYLKKFRDALVNYNQLRNVIVSNKEFETLLLNKGAVKRA